MSDNKCLRVAALCAALLFVGWCSSLSTRAQGIPPTPTGPGTAARRPPRTYDVEHYIIRTRFDVSDHKVYGDVSIKLKPLNVPIESFNLDASGLKIESVVLEPNSMPLVWRTSSDHLTIDLPQTFPVSDSFSVRIVYHAEPQKGLYFIPAHQIAPGFVQPAQIWSQGEAEDNHYWFPLYDFPDDKATVEQYITTPANEIAIANGSLLEVVSNPNKTHTFHWSMDQPFSSYLISLIVGDYAQIKDRYGDIGLEFNTYRGTEEIARRVFARTPQMMRWFEKELNYPFPYRRYAQTVVASFIFGGMENITATTHADTEILYSVPGQPSDSADDLISHEMSHSWFGDLVTCRDWSELWLNEGFATFMEASFKEGVGGRAAYLHELEDDQSEYLADESTSHRHPLVNLNYTTGMELFDATTYKKGGLVVHMLRQTVGDELFWKALNVYLNEFKYDNVTSADLERVFERVTGKDLAWFFKQWVYQAGYPDLKIRYSYDAAAKKLIVQVDQTQKPDVQVPAVFKLPLEIQLTTRGGAQTVLADVTQRSQRFTYDVSDNPSKVVVDPDFKLLEKVDVSRK